MPFVPPNQQRQSTEGINGHLSISVHESVCVCFMHSGYYVECLRNSLFAAINHKQSKWIVIHFCPNLWHDIQKNQLLLAVIQWSPPSESKGPYTLRADMCVFMCGVNGPVCSL